MVLVVVVVVVVVVLVLVAGAVVVVDGGAVVVVAAVSVSSVVATESTPAGVAGVTSLGFDEHAANETAMTPKHNPQVVRALMTEPSPLDLTGGYRQLTRRTQGGDRVVRFGSFRPIRGAARPLQCGPVFETGCAGNAPWSDRGPY